MRTERIICLAMCLVLALSVSARDRDGWCSSHVRLGIEWGYTATVYEQHCYDYISDAGSMVQSEGHGPRYNSNGCFLSYVGIETWKKAETDLVTGYIGIVQGRRVVPVMLRETIYFNGCRSDGFKLFAEGGVALAPTFQNKQVFMARAGAGYRLMLGDKPAMDFFMSVHGAHDHPRSVYVTEHSYSVPMDDLRSSHRDCLGISVGMALSF